jgi:hypothetical protein
LTFHRQDVDFNADGSSIRVWLYRPESVSERLPIVVLPGGFSCMKEMHLANFAEVFAGAGRTFRAA